MAAMSTVLTPFNSKDGEVSFTTSGSTLEKPKMVTFRRKIPTGSTGTAVGVVSVYHATEDSDGNILPQKQAFELHVKSPIQGTSTDRDAALVIARDIMASDEATAFFAGLTFPNP